MVDGQVVDAFVSAVRFSARFGFAGPCLLIAYNFLQCMHQFSVDGYPTWVNSRTCKNLGRCAMLRSVIERKGGCIMWHVRAIRLECKHPRQTIAAVTLGREAQVRGK